jgi:diacylglycerol kinase family enzyme
MQRLIVVYNPSSSQYVHVRDEVLTQLSRLEGVMVGKFAIKKAPFDDNLKELKKVLKNGDLVIAAGGDATAAVAANAILESGKDITFAALPYGNFNDLAHTLGTMRFEDIFEGADSTQKLYPLDIIVDGEHWRYATCYVTMGMTAEAVELFDEPKIRKKMQKGRRSSWRSYLQLAKWYFKNRHKKIFIPKFKLNGELYERRISDYVAVNGRFVSRVMKGGDDYLNPKVFQSEVEKITSFPRLFMFMAKSIMSRVPGNKTNGDLIEFLEPATVELQAEGEYKIFKNIHKIEIKKSEKYLKVIHKK